MNYENWHMKIENRNRTTTIEIHNYDNQNFDDEKAKQFYGDGLIYGGEPQLIEKRETKKVEEVKKEEQVVKKIAKYSWLDEEKKVKIYIDLS